LLGDLGADVLKIEGLEGDENRAYQPLVEGQSTSYLSVNRAKRGMTLDLKNPRGQETLHRLVEGVDVLIHNYRAGSVVGLGVAYETLIQRNPDLVYCSITGFGPQGPLSAKPGYDSVVQAFSGIMSMTGEPGRPPVRNGVAALDHGTGLMAFGGILAALHARSMGYARGQRVDVSLLQTATSFLSMFAVDWLAAGKIAQRTGSGLGNLVPYGAYRAADGFLYIGAPNPGAWGRLCEAIGRTDLMSDPRFTTNSDRLRHRDELTTVLEDHFSSAPAAEWVERLDRVNVAASVVHTVDQALSHPQVVANGMVTPCRLAEGTEIALPGVPIVFSETPGEPGGPPPRLGEHTDAILAERGFSSTEIAALREGGVIR
jgi:formyl-CoA transferase/CoA:oxalate CoA-transferase